MQSRIRPTLNPPVAVTTATPPLTAISGRCRTRLLRPLLASLFYLLLGLALAAQAMGAVEMDVQRGVIVIGEDQSVRVGTARDSRDEDRDDDFDDDAWLEFDEDFECGEMIDFQRVDGLTLGLTQHLHGSGRHGPQLTLSEARALHRGRWLFEAEFEQPIIPDHLSIGGGFFRLTVPFAGLDDRIINDDENLLAALLIKEDYRDYFEDEGIQAFLHQQFTDDTSLRATVIRSKQSSVENSTSTSLTRWDEDFRPNPDIDEGNLRALRFAAEFDTRPYNRAPASAHWYRVEWERGDGGLGGDFDYGRIQADLREYLRTSPGQQLSLRVIYGSNRLGELPVQKRFAIGGIGTLRAHAFKEFTGDEVLLGNVEYRFDLDRDFVAMVFCDTGATAERSSGGSVRDQQFALDGGIGLGFQEERAAIYLARDLRRPDAELKLSFRLSTTF